LQDSWFHLQRVRIGEDAYLACTCPHDWMSTCVHAKFLRANWEKSFAFLDEVEWDSAGESSVHQSPSELDPGLINRDRRSHRNVQSSIY
jgi:hypothetical protein